MSLDVGLEKNHSDYYSCCPWIVVLLKWLLPQLSPLDLEVL